MSPSSSSADAAATAGVTGRSPSGRLRPPYPPYLRTLVFRAVLLWMLLRIALLLLGDGVLSLGASMVVVGAVALLAWTEARRSREPVFHAILGTSPALPAATGALAAIICEALVRFLLRIL